MASADRKIPHTANVAAATGEVSEHISAVIMKSTCEGCKNLTNGHCLLLLMGSVRSQAAPLQWFDLMGNTEIAFNYAHIRS